jgi:hypothetical protein
MSFLSLETIPPSRQERNVGAGRRIDTRPSWRAVRLGGRWTDAEAKSAHVATILADCDPSGSGPSQALSQFL